jgi:hypothetical protein
MYDTTLGSTGRVLGCIVAISLRTLCGQMAPSLQDSFKTLVQGPALSSKPSQEEISTLGKRVSAASPDEIRGALPWMIAASRVGDDVRTTYAFVGLLAVGLRMDSPALLKDYMGDMVTLLASSDTLVQRAGAFVLGSVQERQATLVPGLSHDLVSFVKRTDRDLEAQLTAVAFLIEKWQEEPAAQEAVGSFLSRDLDADSRARILRAIGQAKGDGRPARFTDLIIAALDDSNESVKSTAIKMLNLIGPLAVMRAEPSLRKLAQEPGQPEAIRSAAAKTLSDAGLRMK